MTDNDLHQVVVLGSTGSVGTNTLDVLARNHAVYSVYALAANRNVDLLFSQCQQFNPRIAVMADRQAADELRARLARAKASTQVATGPDAIEEICRHAAVKSVMAAMVGFSGLAPVMAAANAGKRILLANKESMVVAGQLLVDAARRGGATILPVDSEHNAIFQCLPVDESGRWHERVASLVLTASGGPFRQFSGEQMESVTVAQALAHPNWDMGKKISIDSATMMNKGLEVIEASHLFGVPEADIEVLVHPQSVVHSMVRYRDGSVLAQMGEADMRTPIAHALGWPERIDSGVSALDFTSLAGLQFEQPDPLRFPCLQLARVALQRGGSAPAVLNAANEIAVERFLSEKIKFPDIARSVAAALEQVPQQRLETLAAVSELDAVARRFTDDFINSGFKMMEIA